MTLSALLLALCLTAGTRVVTADVYQLTAENFIDVIDGPHHKIVKFFAPWCGHCTHIAPFFQTASAAYATEDTDILFAQVDVDEEGVIAQELGVRNYPTFLYFPAGNPDDYEELALGNTVASMFSTINHKFELNRRLPVPDVPDLITQLHSADEFTTAVSRRSGALVVNIYGERCPHNCLNMHMNLPRIAEIFQNEDVSFARLHGEDHPDIVRRFNALWYPAILFFPAPEQGIPLRDPVTGDFKHILYSDSKVDPVALLDFLNVELGTSRAEDGSLLADAANVPALDDVVSASRLSSTSSLLADMTAAAALLPPHDPDDRYPDMTLSYLRLARKVHELQQLQDQAGSESTEGGVVKQWMQDELARLQEGSLPGTNISAEDRDDLFLAANVVKVFLGKLQEEQSGDEIASSGQGEDAGLSEL